MGFPCCSFFPPSCCCSREESNSLSWPYKDRNPCMGRLIVLKSIHRLTLIQPACLFFGMRLLPAVIAASSNHCVLSAGKTSRDSPCWQNTIAMQEAFPPNTFSNFLSFYPWWKERAFDSSMGCLSENKNPSIWVWIWGKYQRADKCKLWLQTDPF